MTQDKTYNKMIFLSVTLVIVFFLQFNLGLVGNFILMFLTYSALLALLPTWMKNEQITNKKKLLLFIIACLLMSSFVFHNYDFIDTRSFLLWFWVISILSLSVSFLFNINKNKK